LKIEEEKMKITMVIPTYWGRKKTEGWKEGDAIYDHPTPLDEEGTLKRAIKSINILKDKDFNLVIIAAATAPDIEEQVEKKVKEIVSSITTGVRTDVFSHSDLKKIHEFFDNNSMTEYKKLLQLRGYSNIRNLCLFIPHIQDSDISILIDDDEIFEDSNFIGKAKEFIGKKFGNSIIHGIAGYYLQEDNDFLVNKELKPYMVHWDKFDKMNKGFKEIIGSEPRLKKTPFVFGGNMVIDSSLFKKIPFDPYVTRGEDIDYLMNARMFGYHFYLDNKLAIKHLPPPKPHPTWRRIREDIYRFMYEREKIRAQKKVEGMIKISAEDFDPYPGVFLKDNLEEKIIKTSEILALEYLAENNPKDAKESLNNMLINSNSLNFGNPFSNYLKIQEKWEKMMNIIEKDKLKRKIGNL
jgi:hypothetical protein